MKPALCTHKYMYQLDDRSADILVRYTHQIIEGVDVVTITGIEADPEAIAVIKDDMASKDNDHLIKDLADDLVFSATFRWTERIELRVDPAFAQVATQVFEWWDGKPEYVGACCNPECDAGPIIVPVEVEND